MTAPIALYFWPTPNGRKITIALEEMGLPYEIHPININAGDQFAPEFLTFSPNNRMPAIIDPDGPDGASVSIFESGAILQYLARKTGQFYGETERDRISVDEWLMWQMGGVGPMAGQAHHFLKYSPSMTPPHVLPYAQDRYRNEVGRLYGVLDKQLEVQNFVAGDFYSIADMAIWPWAKGWEGQQQTLDDKPNFAAWLARVGDRPATAKGQEVGAELRSDVPMTAEQQKMFFGIKS
jgi:GSH-dependent disulfide-bond oxidoreductase